MKYSVLSHPFETLSTGNKVYGDEPSRSLLIDCADFLWLGKHQCFIVDRADDIITISTTHRVHRILTDADGSVKWGCFSDKYGYTTVIATSSLITTVDLFTHRGGPVRGCRRDAELGIFGEDLNDLIDMSH